MAWDFHKSENKVIIHVNNEKSKDCLSSRGLTVFAVEVAPKSMMVRFFHGLANFREKQVTSLYIVSFYGTFIMIMSMWRVASSDLNTSAVLGVSKLIMNLMYPCFPVQFAINIHNCSVFHM